METPNPNPNFLREIKEKIKKETPHGRGYGRFISSVRLTAIITLVVVSVLMLSLFLSDIVERIQGAEFEDLSLFQNISGFVFGFLLISLVAVLGIYVIYRQTDWPFVKERFRFFVASFFLVILLSASTIFLSENELTPVGDFLDGLKDRIEESLSLKSLLEPDYLKNIRNIEGAIVLVEKAGADWTIVVKSETQEVQLTLERRFGEFKVGDRVRIEYELDGDERDVERIVKI